MPAACLAHRRSWEGRAGEKTYSLQPEPGCLSLIHGSEGRVGPWAKCHDKGWFDLSLPVG